MLARWNLKKAAKHNSKLKKALSKQLAAPNHAQSNTFLKNFLGTTKKITMLKSPFQNLS